MLRKHRRHNNRLLHSRPRLLNRSVIMHVSNATNGASSGSSAESIVVQRKLSVLPDLCVNNSRRANESQHPRDHNHNRSNDV